MVVVAWLVAVQGLGEVLAILKLAEAELACSIVIVAVPGEVFLGHGTASQALLLAMLPDAAVGIATVRSLRDGHSELLRGRSGEGADAAHVSFADEAVWVRGTSLARRILMIVVELGELCAHGGQRRCRVHPRVRVIELGLVAPELILASSELLLPHHALQQHGVCKCSIMRLASYLVLIPAACASIFWKSSTLLLVRPRRRAVQVHAEAQVVASG